MSRGHHHHRAFYTEHDWSYTNASRCQSAAAKCASAQTLADECKRLCQDSDQLAETNKKEVGQAFDQRIKDVCFWKTEISNRISGLNDEVDKLHAYRNRVQEALHACEQPLYVAQQCLLKRKNRQSIDLVYDEPERQLEKEVSLIQDAQNILRHSVEQINEQLRADESTIRQLNRDVVDKSTALGVDLKATTVKPLTVSLEPMRFQHGVKQPPRSSSLDEWEGSSQFHIGKAEEEMVRSQKLYPLTDDILRQTSTDIRNQHEKVSAALTDRVREARQAKEQLEVHLAKVVHQMAEMEHTLSQVKHTTSHKVPLLAVAQKRLQTRKHRPNVEQCRDEPELHLEKEVSEMERSIQELQQKESETREMLRLLLQNKRTLEEEIRVKTNTLYIDEVQCLSLLAGPLFIPH